MPWLEIFAFHRGIQGKKRKTGENTGFHVNFCERQFLGEEVLDVVKLCLFHYMCLSMFKLSETRFGIVFGVLLALRDSIGMYVPLAKVHVLAKGTA